MTLESGTMRFNRDINRVELWDGKKWQVVPMKRKCDVCDQSVELHGEGWFYDHVIKSDLLWSTRKICPGSGTRPMDSSDET